jgi:hypothetical protein
VTRNSYTRFTNTLFFTLIVVVILLAFLFMAVRSAHAAMPQQTYDIQGGTFLGFQYEPVMVYRNVPVPPSGYVHGSMVRVNAQVYRVESDGRVYLICPNGGWFGGKNPLKMFAPGDKVTLHLDIARGRLYVILPDKKHGLSREFRYNVIETAAE